MENIIAWKNFLNQEEKEIIESESKKYQWNLEGSSQNTPLTRMFWFKNLIGSTKTKELFKSKMESYLNKSIEVDRIYANGQAHGQCGMFHQDIPGCDYSLVYYLHEDWQPEYGGHLMIKINNTIESYWPESNSAILFKSDLWHCPLEPTIYCRTQRLSITFKFRIL